MSGPAWTHRAVAIHRQDSGWHVGTHGRPGETINGLTTGIISSATREAEVLQIELDRQTLDAVSAKGFS